MMKHTQLTDEQIRETVESLRMTDYEKSVLLKRAIEDRQPEARFVIYAKWMQSNP